MNTLVLTLFLLLCLSVCVRLAGLAAMKFPMSVQITRGSEVAKIIFYAGLALWCAWELWR